jgi:hypothetical protein
MTWNPNYQWANPTANWQQTYQNSQWYQKPMMPTQPMQQQMPQQMPQQFQMPQFSPQQINQFLSYMQSRPIANFMGDPRYQPQQSQYPMYQPSQQQTVIPSANTGPKLAAR